MLFIILEDGRKIQLRLAVKLDINTNIKFENEIRTELWVSFIFLLFNQITLFLFYLKNKSGFTVVPLNLKSQSSKFKDESILLEQDETLEENSMEKNENSKSYLENHFLISIFYIFICQSRYES